MATNLQNDTFGLKSHAANSASQQPPAVNWNQILSQMGARPGPMNVPQMVGAHQVNSYLNYGPQLQGAMGQIAGVNAGNQQASLAIKQMQAGLDAERMRQEGHTQRLSMMAPLFQLLAGGGGGGGGNRLSGFVTPHGQAALNLPQNASPHELASLLGAVRSSLA